MGIHVQLSQGSGGLGNDCHVGADQHLQDRNGSLIDFDQGRGTSRHSEERS